MSDKKSYSELRKELQQASEVVKIGSHYAHYKHPEVPYIVKGLLIIEENNEIAVRYCSTANADVEFVRPLSVWMESVQWNGQEVERFKLLDGPQALG